MYCPECGQDADYIPTDVWCSPRWPRCLGCFAPLSKWPRDVRIDTPLPYDPVIVNLDEDESTSDEFASSSV